MPVGLTEAEKVMTGKVKSLELVEEAFALVVKDGNPMEENRYKLQELKAQLARSLEF